MDANNSQILYHLFEDARQSYTQLAKKCGISKESVAYRMQTMQTRGIISGYTSILNTYALGKKMYRLMFSGCITHNLEEIRTIENIAWVVELSGGRWTLTIACYCKNHRELKQILPKIFHCLTGVQNYDLMEIIGISYFFPKIFQENTICMKTEESAIVNISENEKKIMKQLIDNARTPVTEIAHRAKLSVTATTYLIKKIFKEKILVGSIPIINYKTLGFDHYKIFIHLANPRAYSSVKENVKLHPGLIHMTKVIGNHDIECEIIAIQLGDVTDYLDRMNKNGEIQKYEIILTRNILLHNEGL